MPKNTQKTSIQQQLNRQKYQSKRESENKTAGDEELLNQVKNSPFFQGEKGQSGTEQEGVAEDIENEEMSEGYEEIENRGEDERKVNNNDENKEKNNKEEENSSPLSEEGGQEGVLEKNKKNNEDEKSNEKKDDKNDKKDNVMSDKDGKTPDAIPLASDEKENKENKKNKSEKEEGQNQKNPKENADGLEKSKNSKINQAKKIIDATKKATKGDVTGATEKMAKMGVYTITRVILDFLWSIIWTPWIILALPGLTLYAAFSLLIPSMTQLGEDDILGAKLKFGGKIFSKIVELIIIVILDLIVIIILAILFIFIFLLAYAIAHPFKSTDMAVEFFGGWYNMLKAFITVATD